MPDVETIKIQLDAIRRQADYWVDFDVSARERQGLGSNDDTHIIAPPFWPSHGQLKAWSAALSAAVEALSDADAF